MKRLLFALGLVAMALAGSLAAWKLADDGVRPAAFTVSVPGSLQTLTAAEPGTRLTSPSGEFEVAVTDQGILWNGPGGSINLTAGGVTLKSSSALGVQGSGMVSVQGTLVRLCGSGGTPLARVGDLTQPFNFPLVDPRGPVWGLAQAPIAQGSPTVLAC